MITSSSPKTTDWRRDLTQNTEVSKYLQIDQTKKKKKKIGHEN